MDGKSLEDFPINAGVLETSICGPAMVLSVILQSILMTLLSTLNVIECMICDHSLSWLLNLKTKFVSFEFSGAIDVTLDLSLLNELGFKGWN